MSLRVTIRRREITRAKLDLRARGRLNRRTHELRHAPRMRPLRPALRAGQAPPALHQLPAAVVGALRSRRDEEGISKEGTLWPAAHDLALPGNAPDRKGGVHCVAGRDDHADPRNEAACGAFRGSW